MTHSSIFNFKVFLSSYLLFWHVTANPVGGLNAEGAGSSITAIAADLEHSYNVFKEVSRNSKWGALESDFVKPSALSYGFRSAPVLDYARLLQTYKSAERRVLFFDYDGTLVPFQSPLKPHEHEGLISWLTQIAADPKNEVWIVTARGTARVDEFFGSIPNLRLGANHGTVIKSGGSWINLADSGHYDLSWQTPVKSILDKYGNIGSDKMTSRVIVRESDASLLYSPLSHDPENRAAVEKLMVKAESELRTLVSNNHWPVEVTKVKDIIEIKTIGLNKGTLVNGAVNQNHDFVMAVGDDKRDEDMFKVLRAKQSASAHADNIFSVSVGGAGKLVSSRFKTGSLLIIIDNSGMECANAGPAMESSEEDDKH